MEITAQIRASHHGLSRCSEQFLDYVNQEPECLKFANFGLLELDSDLFRLQPWPTFVNRTMKAEMELASVAVLNLIKSIPQRIFNNCPVQIGEYFNIPTEEVENQLVVANEAYLKLLLGRGDFMLSPQGWKCLEFNVTGNLGGLQIAGWENQYLRVPVIDRYIKKYNVKLYNKNLVFILMDHLISIGLDGICPGDDTLNCAVLVDALVDDDTGGSDYHRFRYVYRNFLAMRNPNLKGEMIFCDYSHLDVVNNEVRFKGNRVHVILELKTDSQPSDILKCFKDGRVVILNGPITELLSNKLMLAALSEYKDSGLFSLAEKQIIEKYIPWTRTLGSSEMNDKQGEKNRKGDKNLREFMIENRENLVIKPGNAFGGFGISVGKMTPAKEWLDAVDNAFSQKGYVVQEYVASNVYLYQYGEEGYAEHDAVWGFFVFGSQYAGGWVRVMPRAGSKGILNCHQGARASVILEAEQ